MRCTRKYKRLIKRITKHYRVPSTDPTDLDAFNYIQLSFNLTGKCNLACAYCAVNGGELKNTDLNPELIKYFYKKIRKQYPSSWLDLNCMGNGEPLLNWKAIEAVDNIRIHDDKVRCFVTTNGTLKEKVLRLAKKNWIITISYDGVINEKLRGKSELVENTIKELKKKNYNKFLVRITFIPGSEKFLNNSFDRLKKLGVKYILLGPVFPFGRYNNKNLSFNQEKLYTSMKYAESICLKPILTLQEECTLATRGYYIMPDGKISICYVKYIKPTEENRKLAEKKGCILFPYKKLFNFNE